MTISIHELSVGDVMTPTPYCLDYDCTLGCAYRLLTEKNVQGAPILGGDGELVGVIAISDLLDLLGGILEPEGLSEAQRKQLEGATVAEHMNKRPVTCAEDLTLVEACKLLIHEHKHRLVVTSYGAPVGILSAIDVVRTVACVDETCRFKRDGLKKKLKTEEDPVEVMGQ